MVCPKINEMLRIIQYKAIYSSNKCNEVGKELADCWVTDGKDSTEGPAQINAQ